MKSRPVILHVGGTDPSGGAGLAADLKSTSALGGHGCIAVTAVTVQNSGKVHSWQLVDPDITAAQMRATAEDGIPDAVKSGMLGSPGTVEAVSRVLANELAGIPYVLDPVLVAGSGDGLARSGLEKDLIRFLVPRATLVTPNLDEAEAFTGHSVRTRAAMEKAASEILAMGAGSVLLKGGHLQGQPFDLLLDGDSMRWFPGSWIVPGKVHGTGCTLASSCATMIGAGYTVTDAVERSLQYLRGTIAGSFHRKLGRLLGHFPGMGQLPAHFDGSAFYRTPCFCPSCGGELGHRAEHPICQRCGLVFYRNPLPAVILLLENEGRILVARRGSPPAKGELCLPGGFIDLGESPEEAAERELKEETSLTDPELELIGADSDLTDYGSVALFTYRVRNWQGEPLAGDDVSELMWMEPEDIPPMAFRAHDRIVDSIRKKGLKWQL